MIPPLARSVWPLIQAPSGPARNATASAISSGLAETFQRRHLGQLVDHLLRLAVEEELGRDRPGRDRVDGDVSSAQLLGEDAGHGLDRGLGGGIDAVGRLQQAGDAGREVDDPAAVAQAARRFAQRIEGALQIDRDVAIEQCVAAVGDGRQAHDAGIVDQHVDAAERGFSRVEHARHGGDIRDVGLSRHGPAAGPLDPGDHRRRGSAVAGIVHHDGEAVLGQALGDRGADTAGGTGDDGNLIGLGGHDLSPLGLATGDRRLTEQHAPSQAADNHA